MSSPSTSEGPLARLRRGSPRDGGSYNSDFSTDPGHNPCLRSLRASLLGHPLSRAAPSRRQAGQSGRLRRRAPPEGANPTVGRASPRTSRDNGRIRFRRSPRLASPRHSRRSPVIYGLGQSAIARVRQGFDTPRGSTPPSAFHPRRSSDRSRSTAPRRCLSQAGSSTRETPL